MKENNPIPAPEEIKPILTILEQTNTKFLVKTFDSPAKSARQAADLIGCPLGAIVKSLFFVMRKTGEYLLILTSGENRVDLERLYSQFQQSLVPTDPKTVLMRTGFPVGAVPPFGHKDDFPTLMDMDLLQYDQIWASAGSIYSVMGLKPQDLLRISKAELYRVKEE